MYRQDSSFSCDTLNDQTIRACYISKAGVNHPELFEKYVKDMCTHMIYDHHKANCKCGFCGIKEPLDFCSNKQCVSIRLSLEFLPLFQYFVYLKIRAIFLSNFSCFSIKILVFYYRYVLLTAKCYKFMNKCKICEKCCKYTIKPES